MTNEAQRSGTDAAVAAGACADGTYAPADAGRTEDDRLAALHRLGVLDTPPESAFDDIVAVLTHTLRVPMGALSLVDADRQWFKAAHGLPMRETGRDIAFCEHVVASGRAVIVEDARNDPRFSSNPMVVGPPYVRGYLGVPVHAFGHTVGALCAIASDAREFDDVQLATIERFARNAESMLELRWRRSLEAAPTVAEVRDRAQRMHELADFDALVGNDPRAVWLYDRGSMRFLAVNDAMVSQYGWSREQLLSMSILEIRDAHEAAVLTTVLDNIDLFPETLSRLWRHRRHDGSAMDVKITSAECELGGRACRLVYSTDMTVRIVAEQSTLIAVRHDSLTGLPNRQVFLDALGAALDGPLPPPAHEVAVLAIGLDRFKLVNDCFGHVVGDLVIAAAAARIASLSGPDATVSRLGGDEFAVLMTDAAGESAEHFARRIGARLSEPFIVAGDEHFFTASIGVTRCRPHMSALDALAEADIAMYAAKASGRDGVALFDDELRARTLNFSAIAHDLHAAIGDRQLQLEYQPIIDTTSDRISFEALLRWQHPRRGRLVPAEFLTIAEEAGQIRPIGRWVLDTATAAAAELARQPRFGHMSVNVSLHQFNESLVHDVANALDKAGLDARHLIVEVTESALADPPLAERIVADLRALGVGVHIDDFGTGFSSLSRLRSLDATGLKIDQSFVHDLDNATSRAITETIANLAHGLHLDTVAEGVERVEQQDALVAMGCRYLQGYLYGRAESLEHAVRRLAFGTPET